MVDIKKRQSKPKEGDVYSILLDGGFFAFCQVSRGQDYAFFDFRSKSTPPLKEIINNPVAFRIPMVQGAPKEGGWNFLGNLPLNGSLGEEAIYWNQPVGSNVVYIIKGGEQIPSTIMDIKNLEPFAWWFEQHAVERLNDYFSGKSNKTVEFFKKIKEYDSKTGQEVRKS